MGLFNSRAYREENNSFHAVRKKKKPSHAKPWNRHETWVGFFFFLDETSISLSLFWNQSKALFLGNMIKKEKLTRQANEPKYTIFKVSIIYLIFTVNRIGQKEITLLSELQNCIYFSSMYLYLQLQENSEPTIPTILSSTFLSILQILLQIHRSPHGDHAQTDQVAYQTEEITAEHTLQLFYWWNTKFYYWPSILSLILLQLQ